MAAFAASPTSERIGIDGKMYDMPHLTAARRALASVGRGRHVMSSSLANEFEPSDDHAAIREGVRSVVTRFGDDYWLARDDDGVFPFEFHRAMADAGWLGITMPEEYGGAGLGVTEAAIMMHEVASHGGGMAAASAVHINLFGPHPIVVKGTPEQKARWVPRLVAGEDQCAFGFTEPDAGLNTTRIKTFAQKVSGRLHRSRAEGLDLDGAGRQQDHAADPNHQLRGLRAADRRHHDLLHRSRPIEDRGPPIPKMGRKAVDSNAIFIDGLFIPDSDRIGEEGKGFSYILHSLNPERILIARRSRSGSARMRCAARPNMPATASCSIVRSDRIRASSIRLRKNGCIWKRHGKW